MPFPRRKSFHTEPIQADEALDRLERFCAFRERSPKEVRQKIADLGQSGETAEQLFQSLQEDGFFNEARFAMAFAGGKFRGNHWGRVRIRLELQHTHGITAELIQEALDSLPEEEYLLTLQRILQKKRAQFGSEDPAGRQKTAAHAIRAGFEPELVFAYL